MAVRDAESDRSGRPSADPRGIHAVTADAVLVVDDADDLRMLFARVLRAEGYVVHEASDGTEALEILAEHPVAIVLLDSTMPGLSGEEVLERIRGQAETAGLPVIMVTGTGEAYQRVAGLLAGADDYLAKPVDLSELVARVRTHLRGVNLWRNVLADDLARRAEIAYALSELPAGEPLEENIARACELLAERLGVGLVTIVARHGLEDPFLLATNDPDTHRSLAGRGFEMGGPAASYEGVYFAPAPRPALTTPLAAALPARDRGAIVAALRGLDGAANGVMVLEVPTETTTRRARATSDRLLGAASDLAPLVSAIVGPALAIRGELRRRESPLRSIIERRAFDAVFQPIVELGSMTTLGYEALTRFHDGVAPDARFAEARELGLSRELEFAAIERAAERAQALDPGAYLSVNMSPPTLSDPDVRQLLQRFGSRRIVIEITEQEAISDYAAINDSIARLGNPPIAVDDAGAGYASLRHILQLRPSYVKLDREWIDGIQDDPARQALLVGLLHFATRIGSTVVAEGIEAPEELDAVRALGVYMGQGFLLGHPSLADALRPAPT